MKADGGKQRLIRYEIQSTGETPLELPFPYLLVVKKDEWDVQRVFRYRLLK